MLQKAFDISKNNSKVDGRGGARPGAGRPAGSMNATTLERMAVKKAFEDRVARNADKLFDAQFNLAKGEQYLMVKYETGNGKNKRTVTEVVDDPETIKAYLNGELDDEDEYYYISTKPAVSVAIDSLLDRAFGKAQQKMELEHSGTLNLNQTFNEEIKDEFEHFLKGKDFTAHAISEHSD